MTVDDYTEQRQTCPLEHPSHPDRPSYSAPGSPLCLGHISKVDSTLTQLATFHQEADQAEHDSALSSSSAPPLSGSKEQPLIYSDSLSEHRREIRGKLASWCQLVAEERNVAPPATPEPSYTVKFLRRHHEWAVQQPWADDYATEILELGRRAWSLLHPSGRRQFEVGPCHEQVLLDIDIVGRCAGTLWAMLTPDDPYAEAASALVCDTCQHHVPAGEWLSYGRRIRKEAA